MKKKVKKTGEIIDVITYNAGVERSKLDRIKYVDADGNELIANLNYYWDLENITEDDEIGYWDKLRNDAAIKIMAARCAYFATESNWEKDVDLSVKIADNLIEKLKEKK